MKRYIKASTHSASDLAKFIEESVNTLLTTDYTNCRYILDEDWAVYVGWSEGFDENDAYVFHNEYNPSAAICCKIADRENSLWTDYDWCNMPYDEETGEDWDTEFTITPNQNYQQTAAWLLEEYDKIVEEFGNEDDYDDEDYEYI